MLVKNKGFKHSVSEAFDISDKSLIKLKDDSKHFKAELDDVKKILNQTILDVPTTNYLDDRTNDYFKSILTELNIEEEELRQKISDLNNHDQFLEKHKSELNKIISKVLFSYYLSFDLYCIFLKNDNYYYLNTQIYNIKISQMKSLNETNNLTIQLNATLIHLEKSNSLINNHLMNVNELKEKYKNIFKIEKVRFK
jgi:Fe-S-cluster containining protein